MENIKTLIRISDAYSDSEMALAKSMFCIDSILREFSGLNMDDKGQATYFTARHDSIITALSIINDYTIKASEACKAIQNSIDELLSQ